MPQCLYCIHLFPYSPICVREFRGVFQNSRLSATAVGVPPSGGPPVRTTGSVNAKMCATGSASASVANVTAGGRLVRSPQMWSAVTRHRFGCFCEALAFGFLLNNTSTSKHFSGEFMNFCTDTPKLDRSASVPPTKGDAKKIQSGDGSPHSKCAAASSPPHRACPAGPLACAPGAAQSH